MDFYIIVQKMQCLIGVTAFGVKKSTITQQTTDLNNVKNSDDEVFLSLGCRCDIGEVYNDITDLCGLAEIVVKCRVIDKQSYVKIGTSIYTDYELEIDKIYKGENLVNRERIHMESLGGILTIREYLEQTKEDERMMGDVELSEEDLTGKLVEMCVNDIPLLEVNQNYILFGIYNSNIQKYNSIGLYQGIFEEVENGMYKRNLSESDIEGQDDIIYSISQEDIVENCEE